MKTRLYSPLKGQVWLSGFYSESGYEDECAEWNGRELADYQKNIEEEMKAYDDGEMTSRGLMEYYWDWESNREFEKSVSEKVVSAFPKVKNIDGTLFGVMELEINNPLNPNEMSSIKDYIAGQYSDGWGEGFEQQGIKIKEGELFISFWQDKNFFIRTEDEIRDTLLEEKAKEINMSM